jgi:hypothetical protein
MMFGLIGEPCKISDMDPYPDSQILGYIPAE